MFIQEIIYLKQLDGTYVINLDLCKSVGTHWIALCVNGNNIIYFDSLRVNHIPKAIIKFIGNKKNHNKYL